MDDPGGLQREPVRTASLVTAIMALIAALGAFGYLTWTEAQVTAFEQALVVCIPIVLALVQWVLSEVARARVTPNNSPRDMDGEPLVRADGEVLVKQRPL